MQYKQYRITGKKGIKFCFSIIFLMNNKRSYPPFNKRIIEGESERDSVFNAILTTEHSRSADTHWIAQSRLLLPRHATGSSCVHKIPAEKMNGKGMRKGRNDNTLEFSK